MLKDFSLQEKSWIMYDWANSAYSVIVTTAILPIFFKTLTKEAGISPHIADAYWGYATSLATLLLAVAAPILGTLGDYRNLKMGLFRVFFALGVLSTAALAFTSQWLPLIVFYVISLIGFSGANLFYDAFLVDVALKDRMDRVSTYGFALGYIGGSTIPFVLAITLIMFGKYIGIPALLATKISFLITAFWWVFFALPFLRNVRQVHFLEREPRLIKTAFKRLFTTLRYIKRYKHIFLFLAAYFFYIDGVNTIIHMAIVYGDSVGLGSGTLLLALLATQVVAFPCAIIYGMLARKFSSGKMILFGIFVYILICYLGYTMETAFDFWVLAMLVASSQGGIQALSRSYFGKMVPQENANEFFGFYDIFGKFAAIMGPALYGLFSQLTGQSRYGVLSVMILFFIGGGIFIFSIKKTWLAPSH